MTKVTIYTTQTCPHCHAAKELFTTKQVTFDEIDITSNPQLREEMTIQTGNTSVPQIFINENHIGGCDNLYALEEQGKLDALLA